MRRTSHDRLWVPEPVHVWPFGIRLQHNILRRFLRQFEVPLVQPRPYIPRRRQVREIPRQVDIIPPFWRKLVEPNSQQSKKNSSAPERCVEARLSRVSYALFCRMPVAIVVRMSSVDRGECAWCGSRTKQGCCSGKGHGGGAGRRWSLSAQIARRNVPKRSRGNLPSRPCTTPYLRRHPTLRWKHITPNLQAQASGWTLISKARMIVDNEFRSILLILISAKNYECKPKIPSLHQAHKMNQISCRLFPSVIQDVYLICC